MDSNTDGEDSNNKYVGAEIDEKIKSLNHLLCYLLVSNTDVLSSGVNKWLNFDINHITNPKNNLIWFHFCIHPGPTFFLSLGIKSFDFLCLHEEKISSLELILADSGLNKI